MYRPIARLWRSKRFERRFSCRIYSTATILPNNRREQESILIGKDSHIRGELLTFAHGGKITLGSFCYVGENTRIWSAQSIEIGNRVLISHNTNIFDSDTHPISAQRRHEQFRQIISSGHPAHISLNEAAVVIEDDVLIGCNAVVLKGIVIGEGAIVGAGSVVTKDVPAWTVVAGNPARVIREITPDER